MSNDVFQSNLDRLREQVKAAFKQASRFVDEVNGRNTDLQAQKQAFLIKRRTTDQTITPNNDEAIDSYIARQTEVADLDILKMFDGEEGLERLFTAQSTLNYLTEALKGDPVVLKTFRKMSKMEDADYSDDYIRLGCANTILLGPRK